MSLAEDAGLDVWLCEFCDVRVEPTDDYVVGLDGMRAHRACLPKGNTRDRKPPAPARIEHTHAWLIAHLSNGL